MASPPEEQKPEAEMEPETGMHVPVDMQAEWVLRIREDDMVRHTHANIHTL